MVWYFKTILKRFVFEAHLDTLNTKLDPTSRTEPAGHSLGGSWCDMSPALTRGALAYCAVVVYWVRGYTGRTGAPPAPPTPRDGGATVDPAGLSRPLDIAVTYAAMACKQGYLAFVCLTAPVT